MQLPGSWLQVERTLTHAKVVGIDLNPIAALDGVETLEGDLNDKEIQDRVRSMLGVVNVVLCDAAPRLSGHKSYDQARIIELNEQALQFAGNVLKQGGNFVVKSFQGTDFPELYAMTKERFYSVKTCITRSTRKGSTEALYYCKKFHRMNMVILRDPYNRPVSNLRVSLTPACNLSCIYCHKEGEKFPKAQISAKEIAEILRVAAKFEIRSVKFTGGEPLLRQDLLEIVRSVPATMESSLTTNGNSAW